MGSESTKKIKNTNKLLSITTIKICILALALSLPFDMMLLNYKHQKIISSSASSKRKKNAPMTELLSQYQHNCIKPNQQLRKKRGGSKTKPLFFNTYPASLGINAVEPIHKSLTNTLTGLKSGGKSFYTSLKSIQLKHCFDSVSTTVTCFNIHPVVEMDDTKLKSNLFFGRYIMAIRNPMTVIPAFFNEKQIKYHGVKGQASEESWREHRDVYFEEMLKDWISVIQTWKEMNRYTIGMYLVYEHLMDPIKGPEQIQKYADQLERAGFEIVVSFDDIPCIWYDSVGGMDVILQYQNYKYDFDDYFPAYKKEQKEIFLNELESLIVMYGDDQELVDVLVMYRDDIRDTMRVED